MLERLYIKQLETLLNCDDYRTVYSWCVCNGVGILSDKGSKKKFVLKAEFEVAFNKEGSKYIKEKYGENKLLEVLNSTMIFFSQNQNNKTEKAKEYKPVGEYEKNFLNSLQLINVEL